METTINPKDGFTKHHKKSTSSAAMESQLLLFIALLMLATVGCSPTAKNQPDKRTEHTPANGIYYWKTVFDLNETERNFLKEHHVKRLYLRLFDVVPAEKNITNTFDFEVVPNATIAFRTTMPDDVEIIPVVYITIEALRLMSHSNEDYAGLIAERVMHIADFNELGDIREVQLDCDWTQQTQDVYFALCQAVKDKLKPHGIQLSCTIRLWQLASACPPVDRGVLMMYNTGNITSPKTQNSILDLNDVKAYLNGKPYDLPLDFAYPTFSWYVWFHDNTYKGLFHDQPDTSLIEEGDTVRQEQVEFSDLQSLDSLVRMKLSADNASIILYHLDSANLSNYSTDEIRQIYHHD